MLLNAEVRHIATFYQCGRSTTISEKSRTISMIDVSNNLSTGRGIKCNSFVVFKQAASELCCGKI